MYLEDIKTMEWTLNDRPLERLSTTSDQCEPKCKLLFSTLPGGTGN